jgi:hypothetical protein
LFADAPNVKALLDERVWPELKARAPAALEVLVQMCSLVAPVSHCAHPFLGGKPTSVQEAVDLLDTLLERAASSSADFSHASLAAAPKRPALVVKWLRARALAAADAPAKPGGGGGGGGAATATDTALQVHATLLDAAAPAMSQADVKIQEELTASKARRDAHVADSRSMAALAKLEEVIVSGAEPTAVLDAFAEMANTSATAANLLHSAYVREPRAGALGLPNAATAKCEVERMRSAVAGVKTATRERLVRMLPDNADVDVLVDAVFHGALSAKEGAKFTLKTLANPKQPPSWTGLASEAKDAGNSAAQTLIALQTVMHPLIFAVTQLHPLDKTAHDTLTIVMAEVTKGLKSNGVNGAIERVLSPLLREYELAWTNFQKSARTDMPTFATVWAKVRTHPGVAGYLAAAAMPQPAAAPAAEGEAAQAKKAAKEASKKLERMEREINALKAHRPGAPSRPGTPRREGDAASRATSPMPNGEDVSAFKVVLGEKPSSSGPNWEANRKRNLIKKFIGGKTLPEGTSVERKG